MRMSIVLHESKDSLAWPVHTTLHIFDESNAAEAHQLLVASYEKGGGTVPPFEPWLAALIHDAEFDSDLCFLVRDSDGVLIAFAHCWTSAFVKDLVVHPDYRRQGLGRLLLLHVFSVFKTRGYSAVALKVQTDNVAAIQLYTQIGMKADV